MNDTWPFLFDLAIPLSLNLHLSQICIMNLIFLFLEHQSMLALPDITRF